MAALVLAFVRDDPELALGLLICGVPAAFFLTSGGALLRDKSAYAVLYLTPAQVVLALRHELTVLPWSGVSEIRALHVEHKFGLGFFAPIQHWLIIATPSRGSVGVVLRLCHEPGTRRSVVRTGRTRWLT